MTERKQSHQGSIPAEGRKQTVITPEESRFSGLVFLGFNSPGLRMTKEGMLLAEVPVDSYYRFKESLLLSPVKGSLKIEKGREDLGEDPDAVTGARISYNFPDGNNGELLIKSSDGVEIASDLQSRIASQAAPKENERGWKNTIRNLRSRISTPKENLDAGSGPGIEVEVGEPLFRISNGQTVLFYKNLSKVNLLS